MNSPDPGDRFDWFYWVMTEEQSHIPHTWENGEASIGPDDRDDRVYVWLTWQGNLFNNEDSK